MHKQRSDLSTSPSLDAPLPGARAALVLLLAINLFNYIDRQVLAAVVPAIETDFFPPENGDAHAGAKIGALMTAFMVSYMVFAPLFGWLADRFSRWWLIGIGVVLWSLASGGSGLAKAAGGFTALFLTRCFVGIGEAAYGPAAPALISDLYPVKVRGQVMAWFYAAIPVGSALGYVLGGLMLRLSGDWPPAFYVVVVPGILLGVLCLLMPDPPRGQADLTRAAAASPLSPGGSEIGGEGVAHSSALPLTPTSLASSPPRTTGFRDYAVLLRTPSYVLNTLGMTAMTFALGGMGYWLPRYIHTDRGGGDLDEVNYYFGLIVVVAGLVSTLLGGFAGDRLRVRFPGSYFLVSGAAMLCGFPLVLGVLVVPFPAAWGLVFLAVFCLFFNTGPTNTVLANVTHPAMRASAFALNIFIIHVLGDAISPLVIGAIKDAWNLAVGFVVVSVMILVAGLLWLWGARYLQRDTALAPTRLD